MIDSDLDEDYDEFLLRTSKFFKKMKQTTKTQKKTIAFFEEIREVFPSEQKMVYENFLQKLIKEVENPFNKRNFVYLDLTSWVESKIRNIPVVEVIKEKM